MINMILLISRIPIGMLTMIFEIPSNLDRDLLDFQSFFPISFNQSFSFQSTIFRRSTQKCIHK